MRTLRSIPLLVATAIISVLPATALAAEATQNVDGTVANATIAIAPEAVALGNLSPGEAVTGAGVVSVTSNMTCYNVDVGEVGGDGKMALLAGTGGDAVLGNALEWKGGDVSGFTNMTGGFARVKSNGLLNTTLAMTFRQQVPNNAVMIAANVYRLTATYQAIAC